MGLPLNVICLNAAMSVLARSGRWYEALDLLTKMRRGAALRDVGVADPAQGGNLGDNPLVEREGEGAKRPVLFLPEPDTITFNAAISGESGLFEVFRWWCRVVRRGFHFFCVDTNVCRWVPRPMGGLDAA